MTDIAIRVDHLSKRYPSTQLRTGTIDALQQRDETTSARLSARRRDAISDFRLRIADSFRRANPQSAIHNSQSEDLWALRDISREAEASYHPCPYRPRQGIIAPLSKTDAELSSSNGR
jgi:hypothetical protein